MVRRKEDGTGGIDRREFVRRAAGGVAGLAAGLMLRASEAASAGERLGATASEQASGARTGGRKAPKLGLYSTTFLGIWYRGPGMPFEELFRWARSAGYEGVEIDGKRPHGNPLDLPESRCRELRKIANSEGIELYAVAANNDFTSPIAEHREAQLICVRELIRMAAHLGAPVVRVFAAWPGITMHENGDLAKYYIAKRIWAETHKQFSREEAWKLCRHGLAETAQWAGEYGVTLALQNHKPVIESYQDMLRMIREVGSPHLKACLDSPLLNDHSDEYTRKATLEVGELEVLSHFGGEYDGAPDGKVRLIKGRRNLPAFIRALVEIGYQGYIGYELCHPLPKIDGQTVGQEYAEKNARLAAEYARQIISGLGT